MPLRVLIVDDHKPVRDGIRSLLAGRADCSVCGEAADGAQAVEIARQLRPDVVLMDLAMPRMDGAEAARIIRNDLPDSRVIVVSQNDAALLSRRAAEIGACGYVSKASLVRDLMPAILHARQAHNGGENSGVSADSRLVEQTPPEQKHLRFIVGDGEMADLIRSTDWARTPLGPPETWSPTLRMMVPFLLANRFPQLLWWGPQFCSIYNDAYVPILGAKHPWAIGRPVSEVWSEIWHILKPLIETPFQGGPATWMEDIPLELNRRGFVEETHFTVAYSPVPDETVPSGIGGVLATVHEITEKIIGERRGAALRDLGARSAEPKTAAEACVAAAQVLARHGRDVPFALFYLFEAQGRTASLAGSTGVDTNDSGCLKTIDFDSDLAEDVWPVVRALETGEIQVASLGRKFDRVPQGPWSDPPCVAAVVPIPSQTPHQFAGFMILGISSRLRFDESYLNFLELISTQVSTSIANARAYEEERRRAEALAEIDRAKTAFFSNVSHEFRTPLTLMMGPLEDTIAHADELPPQARERLLLAHRNSLRLLKLVNTLLDFSRIEAGRIQACYEPVDLSAFTKDLASVFRSAFERAGLRLIVSCAQISEPVYVDREMWEKIVFNLLSNAFKFTFEGEIEVSLKQISGAVELAVRDTGTGIAAKELPHLLERFYRVEGAQGRTFEGSGIGLALVQELTKLHHGEVRAESELGRGSTFIVILPLGKDHLPAERVGAARSQSSTSVSGDAYAQEALRWLPNTSDIAEEMASAPLLSSLDTTPQSMPSAEKAARILLADDNADMREYVQRLLRDQYEVTAVADGRAALEAARKNPPTLILSDIMMPRLDGFALLREIRNDPALKGTPVILLSARAGEESRVEGLGAGADDYLVKPFSARELLARVASHLNMARIRRDAAERETLLRAEADLERDRIRNLFAQTPAPLCLTSGPEHRFTFANREFVKVTGRRSAEEIIGKTVREAFPEIVSQGFADLLDQVYRTGIPHSGNETKVTFEPSGGAPRECYFNFIYQPIRGVDGNVDGILAHGVDVTEQVLARRAIQREEERLRLAQTAAHVGTWEWDATGNRSTLSPELYQIFGTNPQDPHHVETWMANLHPEDRDTVFRLMREGYESGEMDFEYRYRHPELGVRWLYCKGRRVRKESRMFGVVLDVTERKNMEDALRDSQRQFRDLAESVPQLVWMAEPNGDIFWYNRQWYEYTGTTPDEMRGWGWQSVHDPEVLPKVLDAWKHSLRTGERFEMVFPLRGADGKYRHFLTRVVPVRNAVGSIVRWFGTNTDVTAQRRAEEELRESQRRFRDMIDSLPAAVYTTDAEGRITHFNPAAVEFSGRTPEIGSDQWCVTWKIFTADGTPLPHEECPMAVALKEGRIIAGAECMAERPDGTRLWFTPYPQVFRDAQGRITGGINMLVDITERKRAEQAIRESEQRLRAIVETTPECVKLVRADGTVLHMNAAGLVMVGAESSSEVVGKSVYDLIASEDRDRFRRFNEAICRGEKASLEYDIVGLRGVRRRMETHAAPLPQADGSFVHLAVTRDVTEQAQAARVQTLLAAIVGSSDDAILSKDLDGFITSWNKGAEEIFGYSAQEAIGSHITMIVPPDRIDEENEILARIRRGERVEHSETVRRRKDDMLLDVSLTISPLKDGTGRIIGASTVARDISDRKRAERALRESEQRFRVITEASPVMVWMSGVDKLCYYFNKGWLDFVGRTLEQEAGNGWAENVHPDDFDRCLQIYVTSFDARRPFQMEYRLRHHTGEYRWILDCGVPRFAPDGTFEGYMGGCLDIHDQKCTTEALRQSEERLRALSETLESEVAARTRELEKRNAEVLKQSEQLRELSWQLLRTQDEERRHIARELHDSAGQILAVLSMSITTLLESTKQQAPDLAQSVEQADRLLQQLSREIRTTSYLLHPPLLDEMGLDGALSWYIDGLRQRSGLQIELNVSEDFGRLPGDMELVVFRMVQESLTNIHRHSGSKTASIQVVREPGKVSIEIRDKGKGIPAEKLVEIQTKGSGVGIRGMRERLRQFQGELTVESSGQGTTLRVIIPVQPETPAVPQPPGAAALAGPILQPGAPAPRRAASTNAD